jgi:hypothetical protein
MGGKFTRSKKLNKSNSTLDSTNSTITRRRVIYHSSSVCEIELKDFGAIEEDIIEPIFSSKRCSSADSRSRNLSMAGLKAIEREERRKKQEEGLVRNAKKSSQVYNRNLANKKTSEHSDVLVHAQTLPEGSRRSNEAGLRALEREKRMKREREIETRKIYMIKHDKITRLKFNEIHA